jgi:hypothetical protein
VHQMLQTLGQLEPRVGAAEQGLRRQNEAIASAAAQAVAQVAQGWPDSLIDKSAVDARVSQVEKTLALVQQKAEECQQFIGAWKKRNAAAREAKVAAETAAAGQKAQDASSAPGQQARASTSAPVLPRSASAPNGTANGTALNDRQPEQAGAHKSAGASTAVWPQASSSKSAPVVKPASGDAAHRSGKAASTRAAQASASGRAPPAKATGAAGQPSKPVVGSAGPTSGPPAKRPRN